MNENQTWNRLRSIFDRAASLDSSERRSILDREFPHDAEMRKRVEALLTAHDAAASLLESRGAVTSGAEDPAATLERTVEESRSELPERPSASPTFRRHGGNTTGR